VEESVTVSETMKHMTGELEIAVFPDHPHRFLPGEKTIISFRLMG
jgi:dipeptidyl aminopeptidase/acylaminoacyl peptidase